MPFAHPTEEYVSQIATKTFLSLWTFPNPKSPRNQNKEICDLLVVCEDIVIIISVKYIKDYSDQEYNVGYNRWWKYAIKKSTDQLYGAQNELDRITTLSVDNQLIPLPPLRNRKYYRVAVILGDNDYPVHSERGSKEFVHYFKESDFEVFLKEFSTIKDFISYIDEREILLSQHKVTYQRGEGIVAWLLFNDVKDLDKELDIYIDDNYYDSMLYHPKYQELIANEAPSYFWDSIIEYFYIGWKELAFSNMVTSDTTWLKEEKDLSDGIKKQPTFEGMQWMFIQMALEPRAERSKLAIHFLEIISQDKIKIRARLFASFSYPDVCYVFLVRDKEQRVKYVEELFLRCFVACYLIPNCKYVIGLATELEDTNERTFDFAIYQKIKNDDDQILMAYRISKEEGFFSNFWGKEEYSEIPE